MASVEASSSAELSRPSIFSGNDPFWNFKRWWTGNVLCGYHINPGIAEKGIDGILISLPMQMIANLTRTISPEAAVVMIVASTVG